MAYRKINTGNIVVHKTAGGFSSNNVFNNTTSMPNSQTTNFHGFNKSSVMTKIHKIGDVIRSTDNVNLTPEEKRNIWDILSSDY